MSVEINKKKKLGKAVDTEFSLPMEVFCQEQMHRNTGDRKNM